MQFQLARYSITPSLRVAGIEDEDDDEAPRIEGRFRLGATGLPRPLTKSSVVHERTSD
jgi:hypothetical protein